MNENKTKIISLKYTLFHFNTGLARNGSPISTSITVKNDYGSQCVIRIIEHKYFHEMYGEKIIEHSDVINDDTLLNKLSDLKLYELKNNYFSSVGPASHSHWEVEYNNHFKIVGTNDQVPAEIEKVKELLNFDKIIERIKNEVSKE